MRGTRVGDVLMVLGIVAGFLTGMGYWQVGLPTLAMLFVYAEFRIRFLGLP